ncbi:GyrI-like domain-containing protein [Pseudophaeobacter sp.]|uniref:GyrI-like domain-containing protein n=1 Tax=Pseudophaeobacter sp. TaxID=1971739 RepID=UPI003298B217
MRLYGRVRQPVCTARRLEAAALQLENTPDCNVLHLALNCGFQTHSAFSKAFKRQFGVSPSAFRTAPNMARQGRDQDRRFLISAPPATAIDPVEIVDLAPFHFQFRPSSGTFEGQFFRQKDHDIGQQFANLLAQICPPDLFLMSCFPSTPQSLNDDTVPVWFGGGYTAPGAGLWSPDWYRFEGGSWAVFEHRGDYQFLYQTWNRIYRNWLPQTKHELRDEAPFEAYLAAEAAGDQGANCTRIYIPIKKA